MNFVCAIYFSEKDASEFLLSSISETTPFEFLLRRLKKAVIPNIFVVIFEGSNFREEVKKISEENGFHLFLPKGKNKYENLIETGSFFDAWYMGVVPASYVFVFPSITDEMFKSHRLTLSELSTPVFIPRGFAPDIVFFKAFKRLKRYLSPEDYGNPLEKMKRLRGDFLINEFRFVGAACGVFPAENIFVHDEKSLADFQYILRKNPPQQDLFDETCISKLWNESGGNATSDDKQCRICNNTQLQFVLSYASRHIYNCTHCGISFVANIPKLDNLKKIYDNNDYLRERINFLGDGTRIDWDSWLFFREKMLELLRLDVLESQYGNDRSVLEIGCAEGKQLEIFAKRKWNVKGIEISNVMAAMARERGLDVIGGKAFEEVEVPTENYDMIVLSHVIEHLQNPVAVMEKIYSCLKHSGKLVMETPIIPNYYDPDHTFFFNKSSLNFLGRRVGFVNPCSIVVEFYRGKDAQKNIIIEMDKH